MVSSDPVADMLSRIRNAIAVNRHSIELPHSKLKETIATQLQKSGFINDVKVVSDKPFKNLAITINQPGVNAVITHVERVSKPGRRMYVKANDIPRVKNGRGIVIISTSKGIMTGEEATKAKLGGELICKVY